MAGSGIAVTTNGKKSQPRNVVYSTWWWCVQKAEVITVDIFLVESVSAIERGGGGKLIQRDTKKEQQ